MKRHTMNILRARFLNFAIFIVFSVVSAPFCLPAARADQGPADWKAGMASTVITPDQPMWMAGYAARDKPSEGKAHDLNAKALALEDARGTRLVIVTVDLIGIPRPTRDWLEKHVTERYGVPRDALLLNASHTHCGPVIRETKYSIYGNTLYGLSAEQIQQSNQYVERLQ